MVIHEGRNIDPVYEAEMERFAAEDRADPRTGELVFTGSSSMVMWESLREDMAPLPVVNRAFGGSDSAQLWWYADRAVLPRRPRLVVVYIGDNDMPQPAVNVENYLKYVRLFLERVWEQDASTRLVLMSNKPSPSRWDIWSKFQEANEGLQALARSDVRLTYADIVPTLLNAQGFPRPELFLEDMLHMKPETYAAWAQVIRPVVAGLWETIQAEEQGDQ